MVFSKRALIMSGAAIVLLGSGAYFYITRDREPEKVLATVERGDLVQEVSLTGRVKAAKSVDLAFEKGGKVSRAHVAVGAKVNAGDALMSLDSSELLAQLAQSEARAKAARAKLDELKRGARPEDIRIKEAELEKARQDVENDYDGIRDALSDAYAKANDAVRKQTDDFFSSDEESNPQLTFTTKNLSIETAAESKRLGMRGELNSWLAENAVLSGADGPALEAALSKGREHLTAARSYLETLSEALTNAVSLSPATLAGYQANITAALGSVNTAISSLSSIEQAIASHKIVVRRVEEELKLKLAGTAPEQIAAQEAQVEEALANVRSIEAQIAKTVIRAPLTGLVIKQEGKVGEIVSGNTVLVSLISDARFEIEANVPEADIAKVRVGNVGGVTLDAHGSDTLFKATVVAAEPAGTLIEGVATYKITLQFAEDDSRIKAGMTANIDILTDERKGVLWVPQRAVVTKGGERLVRVLVGGAFEDVKVKTGLRSSDGRIEIMEGLSEGMKIAAFGE